MSKKLRSSVFRRGSVLLYMSCGLVMLCGFISLSVDYGRVQLAKTELQTAADLAARYAASGVKHEIEGVSAADAMARAAVTENMVDSKLIKRTQVRVEVGEWNSNSERFTTRTNVDDMNAVRVTVSCSSADGSVVALPFASVLGFNNKTLTATSIALYDAGKYLNANNSGNGSGNNGNNDKATYLKKYVPATSNLWLAGMPNGTWANVGNPHNNPDRAGPTAQSPVEMKNLKLTPGSTLTFDGVNGGANNFLTDERFTGDGNPDWITDNFGGSEHSKSNLKAPINSVIAVFLDDNTPSGSPPPVLDFSTSQSRDFQTLRPQLNQAFFIGDGRRDNGDIQQFVIPNNAKRLFVGTMDGWEWNNNVGGFTVTVTSVAKVVLVK